MNAWNTNSCGAWICRKITISRSSVADDVRAPPLVAVIGWFFHPVAGEWLGVEAVEAPGPELLETAASTVNRSQSGRMQSVDALLTFSQRPTSPTSRSTRKCFDALGCASPRSSARSVTDSLPARERVSISRRRRSAIALNTSDVAAARAMQSSYADIGICQTRWIHVRCLRAAGDEPDGDGWRCMAGRAIGARIGWPRLSGTAPRTPPTDPGETVAINVLVGPERQPNQVEDGSTAASLFADDRAVIVARVNGELVDLDRRLAAGDEVEPVTAADPDGLAVLRHSCAHVLAQAVQEINPDAKLGIGPPVENGFYYDFGVDRPFTPEDLAILEANVGDHQVWTTLLPPGCDG